jgi:hypothetical protein
MDLLGLNKEQPVRKNVNFFKIDYMGSASFDHQADHVKIVPMRGIRLQGFIVMNIGDTNDQIFIRFLSGMSEFQVFYFIRHEILLSGIQKRKNPLTKLTEIIL